MAAGNGKSQPEEAASSARAARLRYVSDEQPGIRRRRAGKGFAYSGPEGERIADDEALGRIRSLAIPPAWKEVWICAQANGHIQATGRDEKGRKQYRYHPRWQAVRDEAKYGRTLAFGEALPAIRARAEEHLAGPGMSREKVLAVVVRLLELTLIRVGNEEYARRNRSIGLTTMLDKHVSVDGSGLRFAFRGKGGIRHEVYLRDRRLARLVKRCQDLPGEELFQYVDEAGEQRTVHSEDVNEYLREVSGSDFTARDFRTWAGTMLAAQTLGEMLAAEPETRTRTNVVRAVERVARQLGNTPSVCRKCYIHPEVIEAYLDGSMVASCDQGDGALPRDLAGLEPAEAAVMALLRRRLGGTKGQSGR